MTNPAHTSGTAFVMAGGGSHGAVQVGMLRALVAAGVKADLVIGTSVGAINGTFFASDPTAEGVERLARIWTGIARHHVYPLSPLRWVRGVLGSQPHLLDPSGLRSVIARSLPVTRLEDTAIRCAVIGARAEDGAEVVITSGAAVDAVLGSASIPVLFPPVLVDGVAIMDGAIANNSAISTAITLGAERVIVPPLCPMPANSYDFSRAWWLLEQAAESTSSGLAVCGYASCSDAISGHETVPRAPRHWRTRRDSTPSMRRRSSSRSRTLTSFCSASARASLQCVPSSSLSSSATSTKLKPVRCADFTKRTRDTSAAPYRRTRPYVRAGSRSSPCRW